MAVSVTMMFEIQSFISVQEVHEIILVMATHGRITNLYCLIVEVKVLNIFFNLVFVTINKNCNTCFKFLYSLKYIDQTHFLLYFLVCLLKEIFVVD